MTGSLARFEYEFDVHIDASVPGHTHLIDQLKLTDTAVVDFFVENFPFIVGLEHQNIDQRREFVRDCFACVLASEFGPPWSVQRLRAVVQTCRDKEYPLIG